MTTRTEQKPGCCNPIILYTRLDNDAAKRPEKCYQLHKWVSHIVKAVINRILILWMQRYNPKTIAENLPHLTSRHLTQLKPSQLSRLQTLEVQNKEEDATDAGRQLIRLYRGCLEMPNSNNFKVHSTGVTFLSHLSDTQLHFLHQTEFTVSRHEKAPMYHQTLTEVALFRDKLTFDQFTPAQKEEWLKNADDFLSTLSPLSVGRHQAFFVSLFEQLAIQEYRKSTTDIQSYIVHLLKHLTKSEREKIVTIVRNFLGNLQADQKLNFTKNHVKILYSELGAEGAVALLRMIPHRNEFNNDFIYTIFSLVSEDRYSSAISFSNLPARDISALFAHLVTIFPQEWETDSKEGFQGSSYDPNLFKKYVAGVINAFKEKRFELADLTDMRLQKIILSQFTYKDFREKAIPYHLILAIPGDYDRLNYIASLNDDQLKEIYALPVTEDNAKLIEACYARNFKRLSFESFLAMPPARQERFGGRLPEPVLKQVLALPINNPENRRLIDVCTNQAGAHWKVLEAFTHRARELQAIDKIDPAFTIKIRDLMSKCA
ncbi:MAG: hypothetical protein H0X51_01770 [Parachlamydiaceae bacterium]|nr:hypothetical protein [Parachlamydiaceae bacterium]